MDYNRAINEINTLRSRAKSLAQQESFYQNAYQLAFKENGGQRPNLAEMLLAHLMIIDEKTASDLSAKDKRFVIKYIQPTEAQLKQIEQYCRKANNDQQTIAYGATGAAMGASLFGWLGLIGGAFAGAALGSGTNQADKPRFLSLLNEALDYYFDCLFYNNQCCYQQLESEQKNNRGGETTKSTQAETEKDPEEELNSLIGLQSIKKQIMMMKASLQKQKYANNKINLHMVFYGNPGTGKTEVARLVAKILHKAGILKTDNFIETDRSGLCGVYLGETAVKTHEVFQKAMDGVLFIDEAYALNGENEQDMYGKEAIAALLKDMEDYRDRVCVILAGYKEPMQKMMALNPGFKSRVNRYIEFPNYSRDDICQILELLAKKSKFTIDPVALDMMVNIVMSRANNKDFANAREARNVLDSIIEIQAFRTQSNLSDMTIRDIDVIEYMESIKEA